MELKTINKKVLSYSDIPDDIKKPYWLMKMGEAFSFVECHIDDDPEELDDELTIWLRENFPELEKEESFFIHIAD
jgi:hypothetical protein